MSHKKHTSENHVDWVSGEIFLSLQKARISRKSFKVQFWYQNAFIKGTRWCIFLEVGPYDFSIISNAYAIDCLIDLSTFRDMARRPTLLKKIFVVLQLMTCFWRNFFYFGKRGVLSPEKMIFRKPMMKVLGSVKSYQIHWVEPPYA